MIITSFLVTPIAANRVLVEWTGTVDWVSHIFLNGKIYDNPLSFGSVTARSVEVVVPDLFNIEVQEAPVGVGVTPTEIEFKRTPLIHWEAVAAANQYVIYRTVDSEEEILQFENQDPLTQFFNVNSIKDLRGNGPKWNQFRIEAIDNFGNESNSQKFSHFVKSVPAVPATVVIAGTSPNLTLTITT